MSLLEEFPIDCPYCGEPITVLVDTSCSEQSYIEDCEVCCQPMVLVAKVDEDGQVGVDARRDDE